jgi:hypothetical protein
MNEQQALRVNGADTSAASTPFTQSQKEYRSGVFKARKDGGGWGLLLVDLFEPPQAVALADGIVVGSASHDARVDGPGVSDEHIRVTVRSDGCYFEDLSSRDGMFVDGVRARRIGVLHGDVVRLGQRLAIFVERDLSSYVGPLARTGALIHGPKQCKDWIDPVLDLARNGSSVCIEGGPGTGKRTLARLAAAIREAVGEIVTVDGQADGKSTLSPGLRPATWLVLDADKLQRAQQQEIAHAVGRTHGVAVIATTSQPLDRAASDGRIAPWFATIFAGKRIAVPSLESRREDIPAIVASIADRRGIALSRFTPEFLEAILRAGWPGGVPQLEDVIIAAADACPDSTLSVAPVAASLVRASRAKPSLPPASDPALARARLEDALARANGSVASAARSLGMSRQAIYREAERLGYDIARRKFTRS